MDEFKTICDLATAKTREEIIEWANQMQKCPYDYEGEAFAEDVCKEGEDAKQCEECWKCALKDIVCKGDETPKKATRKKKLSDKDSNAGVIALKEKAEKMTKAEFEAFTRTCQPKDYGYPDDTEWNVIIDTMTFKEEPKQEVMVQPKNDVKMLNYVDGLVEQIKQMQSQQEQWDAMLKAKIEEAKAKVEDEKAKLQRAIDFNMSQIKVCFDQLDAKETKTQKSITTINGKVVVKKASKKIDPDKCKLLHYAKENSLSEYIKIKEEFDWDAFKKTLNITDNNIVDSNGEVLSIDGLSIVDVDEKMEVK